MSNEFKNLSTAENISVDLGTEFRKSLEGIKLFMRLLIKKLLRIQQSVSKD